MNVESALLPCITGLASAVSTSKRLTALTWPVSAELASSEETDRKSAECEVEILRRAWKIGRGGANMAQKDSPA